MLSLDLRHRFGPFHLEARFDAPPGVTALFGPSGSGKSTIFQAIAGLIRPEAGHIRLGERLLFDAKSGVFLPPHRRRIGCVFQAPHLFPHLSAEANLHYGAPRRAGVDRARILDLLGIAPLLSRRPGALSGGEQQRVAIGRALFSEPDFLLMDEPLSALDEARREEILPWLERLRDEAGLPILYISHSLREVARLATTLVLIDQGKVTAAGPVAELFADPQRSPGGQEAGALLEVTVAGPGPDGLTELRTPSGEPLWLPAGALSPGRRLRLHLPAREVLIAEGPLAGLSALNQIAGEVVSLRDLSEAEVLVALRAGGGELLSRLTRRSARALNLAPGAKVQVILKAAAISGRG